MTTFDYSGLFSDKHLIVDFGDTASYTITGATPTLDDEHLLTGLTGKTRKQGVGQDVVSKSFAPRDLRGRALLLAAKWSGTDQLPYLVSTLGADVTFDGTPQDVVLSSDPGFAAIGSMSLGDGAGFAFWESRQGLTCKRTVLSTRHDATAKLVKDGTGFFPAGTRVTHYADGVLANPISGNIRLAESAAAYAAGNYLLYKIPARHWYGFHLSTWMIDDFAQVAGSGCDLSAVGYMKAPVTIAALPFTGTAFNGRQPTPDPPYVKWEALFDFAPTSRPSASFTFDDANPSDYEIVGPAFEKPRLGYPGGMRATFYPIDSNILAAGSLREFQRLSANGHEIGMHTHWQAAHAAQSDVIYDEFPRHGGVGTHIHYEAQMPGGGVLDVQVQQQWFKDVVGIPDGPQTSGWPHANSPGPVVDAALKTLGVVAQRTGSVPGVINTFPCGDIHRAPIYGTKRDIVAGDLLGHHIAIDNIKAACLAGGGITFATHDVTPGAGTPSGAGGWNEVQLNDVLDACADLKTGRNDSGHNPELMHAPDLRVEPFLSQMIGYPVRRAAAETAGVAF